MTTSEWLKRRQAESDEPYTPAPKADNNYWNPHAANFINGALSQLRGILRAPGALAEYKLADDSLPDDMDISQFDEETQKAILAENQKRKQETAPFWGAISRYANAAADALPDDVKKSYELQGTAGQILGDIEYNLPQIAGQLAIGAATGGGSLGAALGGAAMGASILGNQFNELKEQGVDGKTAFTAAGADAAVQGVMEAAGMKQAMQAGGKLWRGNLLGGHKLAKALGKTGFEEGGTEALQELPEAITNELALKGNLDSMDWGETAQDAAYSGLIGGIMGMPFAGLGYVSEKRRQKQMEAAQAAIQRAQAEGRSPTREEVAEAVQSVPAEAGVDFSQTTAYTLADYLGATNKFNRNAIAGIAGNLMRESGGDTENLNTSADDGTGAYGIAQWMGDRQDALRAFAAERGKDPSDFQTQIDFLVKEIDGIPGLADRLNAAGTPEEAARIFEKEFERSADSEPGNEDRMAKRLANARAVFDGLDGRAAASPVSAEEWLGDYSENLDLTNEEEQQRAQEIEELFEKNDKEAIEKKAEELGWKKEIPAEETRGEQEPSAPGTPAPRIAPVPQQGAAAPQTIRQAGTPAASAAKDRPGKLEGTGVPKARLEAAMKNAELVNTVWDAATGEGERQKAARERLARNNINTDLANAVAQRLSQMGGVPAELQRKPEAAPLSHAQNPPAEAAGGAECPAPSIHIASPIQTPQRGWNGRKKGNAAQASPWKPEETAQAENAQPQAAQAESPQTVSVAPHAPARKIKPLPQGAAGIQKMARKLIETKPNLVRAIQKADAGDAAAQATVSKMKPGLAEEVKAQLSEGGNANETKTSAASVRDEAEENVERPSRAAGEEQNETQEELKLADGYRTESGRPLSEAGAEEFILKPDGSRDFGEISERISQLAKKQTGEELPAGKIRIRVGNEREGMIHAKKHEAQARDAGYTNAEALISDVAAHIDAIYKRENGRGGDSYTIIRMKPSENKKNAVIAAYFDLESDGNGGYYVVVTAMPKNDKKLAKGIKKESLVYSNPTVTLPSLPASDAVSHPGGAKAGAVAESLSTSGAQENSNWEGLSGHPRPTSRTQTSTTDAGLHPSGNFIVARGETTDKGKARKKNPLLPKEDHAKSASVSTEPESHKEPSEPPSIHAPSATSNVAQSAAEGKDYHGFLEGKKGTEEAAEAAQAGGTLDGFLSTLKKERQSDVRTLLSRQFKAPGKRKTQPLSEIVEELAKDGDYTSRVLKGTFPIQGQIYILNTKKGITAPYVALEYFNYLRGQEAKAKPSASTFKDNPDALINWGVVNNAPQAARDIIMKMNPGGENHLDGHLVVGGVPPQPDAKTVNENQKRRPTKEKPKKFANKGGLCRGEFDENAGTITVIGRSASDADIKQRFSLSIEEVHGKVLNGGANVNATLRRIAKEASEKAVDGAIESVKDDKRRAAYREYWENNLMEGKNSALQNRAVDSAAAVIKHFYAEWLFENPAEAGRLGSYRLKALGVYQLNDGYKTESGKPLVGADAKEFILKPDGSKDFGEITAGIEKETGGRMKAAPVRLQVGDERHGYIHLMKHAAQIESRGYSVMDYIGHLLKNFNQIYDQSEPGKPNRFALYVKGDDSKGFMPVDLTFDKSRDGFYTIVTVMPHKGKIKGTLLFDGSANPSSATTDGALSAETNKNGGVGSAITHVKSDVPSTSNVAQDGTEGKDYHGFLEGKPKVIQEKIRLGLEREFKDPRDRTKTRPLSEIMEDLAADDGFSWRELRGYWQIFNGDGSVFLRDVPPLGMQYFKFLREKASDAANAIMEAKPEAAEREEETDAGRVGSVARPVEVQPAGESGRAGGSRGGSGRDSESASGIGGREDGRHGEDHRGEAERGSDRPGETPSERAARGADGAGNAERRAEVPVKESITPEVDAIEEKVEKKAMKDADDKPGHDYVPEAIPKRTEAQRIDDNITALKLLKKIEGEGRKATPQEQAILARYSSWGGLGSAFNWKNRGKLKEVFTEKEINTLQATTTDAFYTPQYVVDAMWDALTKRFGFKGGRVLDPSTGAGIFFGRMPKNVRAKSSMTGTELDPFTARIASQLYQSADIQNKSFSDLMAADGYFDLAVTNVPFGSIRLNDPRYNKANYKLHNYFFAKSVDKVRPGGLIAFITSTDTMDGKGDAATLRRNLDKNVQLVGAIRLPSGTFGDVNTDVTTDIIILRKLEDGEVSHNEWGTVERHEFEVSKEGDNFPTRTAQDINAYFLDHPEMMIGYQTEAWDWRSRQWRVQLSAKKNGMPDIDTSAALKEKLSLLPKNIYKERKAAPANTMKAARNATQKPAPEAASYMNVGEIFQYNGTYSTVEIDGSGKKVIVTLPKTAQKRIGDFVAVRDALDTLLNEQVNPAATEETLEKLRQDLNEKYDAFVKENGLLHNPKNLKLFAESSDAGRVLALEDYHKDSRTKEETAKKADIFTTRTVGTTKQVNVETPTDALAASLQESGRVDVPYMAKQLGKSEDETVKALSGQIIEDPATGEYVSRDEYLSGNVRQKLAVAEQEAKKNPAYKENVEALKGVIPRDLTPAEIKAEPSAPWIPESDIQKFVQGILSYAGDNGIKVTYSRGLGRWAIKMDGWTKQRARSNREYGTEDYPVDKLLDAVLNMSSIKVNPPKHEDDSPATKAEIEAANAATAAANEKAAKLRARFQEWLWENKERKERLLALYNNTYNADVVREYDGSFLQLPGYSLTAHPLRTHQKNAVWRIVNERATLLAHVVGAGKTWTMQTAGMELRRLGLAKKIVYTTPKNTVLQFRKEFLEIYPNAKILVLTSDNLPDAPKKGGKIGKGGKEIPLSTAERKANAVKLARRNATLQKIKTGDWDAIIMSHETLKRLPMSQEAYTEFYEQQLALYRAELEDARATGSRQGVRQMESAIKSMEEKLKKAMNEAEKYDVGQDTFETLGIDQLFVDEADLFKNLEFPTKLSGIHGIQNTGSQRSADLYLKIQFLLNNPATHGVVFATGTPISNTIAEAYTMCKYLDEAGLKEKGIHSFDDFAKMFIDINDSVEPKPDGSGYRMVSKVTGLKNAPEFKREFRKFADVKMVEDLPEVAEARPQAERVAVEVPESAWLKDFRENVIAPRVKAIHDGNVDPSEDNMLKVMGDFRKATLDPRLIDANAPAAEANAKIEALTERVAAEYADSAETKGAQLIFCDMSVPKTQAEETTTAEDASNLSVYERVKEQLIERGIPAEEIAFIHDAKTDAAKQQLFEDVNEGRVRVVIGSTTKMGAGTNMQKKLVALHHLDCPWRPRDLEQREGRILRQGNENKHVRIYNYGAKGSFDAVMWDKIRTKAATINQAINGDLSKRTIEEESEVSLSYAEMQMVCANDPLMIEKLKAEDEVRKLSALQREHEREQAEMERKVQTLPQEIQAYRQNVKDAEADIADLKKRSTEFSITIAGKTYDNRKDANAAFDRAKDTATAYYKKVSQEGGIAAPYTVGKIAGFTIRLSPKGQGGEYTANICGHGVYTAETATAIGAYNTLLKAPETRKKGAEALAKAKEKELADCRKLVGKPFEHAQELRDAEARLEEINRKAAESENASPQERSAPKVEEAASAPQYLVTNARITGKTRVPVVDVTVNVPERRAFDTTKRVKNFLKGATFKILGSEGTFGFRTTKTASHFNDSQNEKARNSLVRRKVLADDASIAEMLQNAVYVDRHGDTAHGTGDKYIDCYAAVKVGNVVYRVRIVAKDKNSNPGEFEIADAELYDFYPVGHGIKNEGTTQPSKTEDREASNEADVNGSALSDITVAQLLEGVNDRTGKPYVDADGNLNYEAGVHPVSEYLVTNARITGETHVPVVDVTANIPKRRAFDTAARVKDFLTGKTFTLIGSDGNFTFTGKSARHFNNSQNAAKRNSAIRRKVLASEESIAAMLENAVYVERHDDTAHGTGDKYIDCYAAIRIGDTVSRVKIVAKDSDRSAGNYEIKDATLYDFYPVKKGIPKEPPSHMESGSDMPPRALRHKATAEERYRSSAPDVVSVAELLTGVNDRDGKPYVDADGNLNYEADVHPVSDLLSGVADETDGGFHSTEELQAHALEVLSPWHPKNVAANGDSLEMDTDGGHLTINVAAGEIAVDRAAASEAYGYDVGEGATAQGSYQRTTRGGVITLTKDGMLSAVSHEAFHHARAFLTKRMNAALEKKYANEEEMAEAYRKWQKARMEGRGTALGKVFQKIQDWAHAIEAIFRENEYDVFRKVENGEVFKNKEMNDAAAGVMYKLNPSNSVMDFLEAKRAPAARTLLSLMDRKYAEAVKNPAVTVRGRAKQKKGWGAAKTLWANTTASTSRIQDPLVRATFLQADKAMRDIRNNYTHLTKLHGKAWELAGKNERELSELLIDEDASQHAYTREELAAKGYGEDFIEAHDRVRNVLAQAYELANNTRMAAKTETKSFTTKKEAENWASLPFFSFKDGEAKVKAVPSADGRGTRYQVTYKTPKYSMQEISPDQEIETDDHTFIHEDLVGNRYVFRTPVPIANKEGYVPHLFHDWFIIGKDENGAERVVGSGTSMKDAVKKADALSKDNAGMTFTIVPKEFNFQNGDMDGVLLGDIEYEKLVKGLQESLTLTLDEARDSLDARKKGRHVFYGAAMHRKGAEGFERNMKWAIQQHIATTSRYAGLDPFKAKAINTFERAFGDFNGNFKGKNAKAEFLQGYINSVLGNPGIGERLVNTVLSKIPGLENMPRPGRQIAGTVTGAMSVAKLGVSPASAIINLLQGVNAVGYLGLRPFLAGVRHAIHPTASDLKILKRLGTDSEVGLESTAASMPVRLSDGASQKMADWYKQFADKAMWGFTFADRLIRRATVIAAYYKGRSQGMKEGEAVAYAKDINRRVNFDYSVADSPRLFRAAQGTIIGDLTLQFQKYGLKELEVISDFLPYFGKSTTAKQKAEFFGLWFAFGGLFNALPFQDLMMELLGALTGSDDPEKDAKKTIIEWAGDDEDKKLLAQAAFYGIGGAAGVDISQRVGLKGVVPDGVEPGGVTWNTVENLWRALQKDDVPAVLRAISPEAGNIYQAVRGYGTDNQGRKTIDYDGFSAAMKALGFRTTEEALATDKRNIINRYKTGRANERKAAREAYIADPTAANKQRLKELGYSEKEIKKLSDPKAKSRIERTIANLSKGDKKALETIINF